MAKRVLVAEDDQDIALMVQDVLEGEGYEVSLTMGLATLQALRDWHPDVVLLDHNMPGMTGVEIAQQIHLDPQMSDIAIIAMTAATRLGPICEEMHADACLGKPFEIDTLLSVMERQTHSAHM